MIRTFTLLFLTVFASIVARAGYTPAPVTGFNKDIVANGVGSARSSTTGSVDDIRDTSGYSFVAQDYRSVAGGTAPTYFLPQNGIINSATTAGLAYQLASYSANNSLKLDTANAAGTLTFQTPVTVSDIYVLATAGAANVTNTTALVTFTDGTTQSFTIATIGDWYSGTTPVALGGIGRVSLGNNVAEGNTTQPKLYEFKLTLTTGNFSKLVANIRFTKTTAPGFLQIMGISVNTISPCGPPTSQPTNLQLTPTVYGVSGSFTASVPPANKYMVLRALTSVGGPDTPPTDGTTYTAGQTLGNATIVSVSSSTTFSDPGLTIGTSYTYAVLGYSDSTCYGISPAYNQVNPLIGNATIPSCSATPGGTYTVGPTGTYPNLSAAMTALNNAAGASGNVIVELQPSYTSTNETYPINVPNISSSPCASGNPTLIIRPAAGATGLVIAGKANFPLLDFNGARRVTLDGRPGGTGTGTFGQLTINNDSTGGVAIRIANDASFNTITYCDIQGRNTNNVSGTTLSGVVYFGQANATTGNGNDYNTISFSNIHGNANGTPAIGISAYGTATRKVNYNDSCTIINCNIYDFFNAGSASTGIKLDAGNNAWTINANNLYQTATRTYTTAAIHRGFWITPNTTSIDSTASGFTINSNYIGGSGPAAGGGTAYTMAGAVGNQFSGMDISVGYAVPTSIQSNTITNLSLTSTAVSTSGIFIGISTANGNNNIGNLVGNTIGSGTNTGAISITTGSASTSFGIRVGGSTTLSTTNVANNVIGSITVTGASAVSSNFTGIGTSGGASTTVSNNLIGSLTTPASISIGASTATTAQVLTGISLANGTTNNVLNNTVANLVNNHATTTATTTASQVRGIAVSTGAATIFGNTVRSLTNSSIQTGAGASAAVSGISMTSTTAGATVTGNRIFALKSTAAAAAVNVVGMYIGSSTTGTNLFNKNFIHSLSATTTAAGAFVTGMDIGAGAVTVVNNMVRVGIDSAGTAITTPFTVRGITRGGTATASKFYYNSVYVGGTGISTATATSTFAFQRNSTPGSGSDDILNNIFVNARSNSGTGGGKHYAVNLVNNANNLNLNYNVYNASGTGGVFAYNGTADVATYTSGWVSSDANSAYGDPGFANATGTAATVDLHIPNGTSSIAEGAATAISGITDDYDGQTRTATPDIGADEFTGTNPNACNAVPAAGTVRTTAATICSGSTVNLSVAGSTAAPGIALQWQSSTDSTSFSNISGANSAVYTTAAITAKTFYRLVVICTNTNQSAISAVLTVNIAPAAICNYCTPTYAQIGTNDYITLLRLRNLSQSTGSNTSPYYINYTNSQNAIPNLVKGRTDSLFLTFGSDGTQFSGVWIDFDRDGTFAATEYFSRSRSVVGNANDTIFITTPATAANGLTRMRVRGGEDVVLTSAQACNASSSGYGQAQDYFVVVSDQPLPVRLLSFTGEHKPAFNQLSWTTATEQNNRGFELQRSADGLNFSAITFVASKATNGNSTATISYSFADAKAFTGNNYYRLKQVDRDDKATYSNIVLLKGDRVNALTLSMVYPNPAKDKLNVIIASPKADRLTLIVSDMTGKIVRQQKVTAIAGDNNFEVNVQALSSGSYIIKAICNDGCETVISRFVKQ